MCYDVSFTVDVEDIRMYLPDLIIDEQIELDFNVTAHILGPGFPVHGAIYRNREDGLPHLKIMEWGVIPFYTKDIDSFSKGRAKWLNVRSERILDDKTSYWYKIRDRRCLIPVTGIYEHREVKGWKKKVPYFIWFCNEPIMYLPALYSVVETVDKETGEMIKRWTFSILTREANAVMRDIHNGGDNAGRMPQFHPAEQAKKWLQPTLTEEEYREFLAYEFPAEDLSHRPVFTIRSPKERPDGKLKYEEWEWDKLPALGTMNPEPRIV